MIGRLAQARRGLWALALVLAMAAPAAAGPPPPWDGLAGPLFSHLGPHDGLPYPSALALAQDGDGFLWIGTPGGLARWDGYRMRVFRHDAGDPTSLPENIVSVLRADGQGRLWLGTATGLVARYDPIREAFVAYAAPTHPPGRIRGLAGDGAGGLWVAGANGLSHLGPDSGAWQPAAPDSDGVPAGSAPCVLHDRAGTLWACAGGTLLRRPPGAAQFEPIALPPGARRAVTALYEDGSGRIWLGTAAGTLARVEPGAAVAEPVAAVAASGSAITAITEPRPGVLWLAQYGGGLRELQVDSGRLRSFTHDPAGPGSLADDSLLAMIVDRSGLVWLASPGGVDRYDPANRTIVTILPSLPNSLLGKDVRALAVGADGGAWLGFRGEGLALIDPVAGRVAEIHPSPDAGVVQAIAPTADGALWIGTAHGLYHADTTGTVRPVPALGDAGITALLADGDRMWIGTAAGLASTGLGDAADAGRVRRWRHDPGDPRSLSDNAVFALMRDREHRLWVGTWHGLNVLDADGGGFRRFLHDPADRGSLPDDDVNSMIEDRRGRLWVATPAGIGVMDPSEPGPPRFRRIGLSDGLPHDTVTVLLEDAQGSIWAGTGGGLAVIDPDRLTARSLGEAEGAWIRTYWAGSGARLPDGTLLFGGFGGLTAIRPLPATPWRYQPPVAVTGVQVGATVRPAAAPIIVRPGDRSFQVEFAALDYSAPERNRYAYRLDGFDSGWVATDAGHRLATYTNVPPGHYQLEIRGSNRDGSWTEPPLRIAVEVRPAWYQRLWVRIVEAALGLAAIGGLMQLRTAMLRHRQRQLERQVTEQTAELTLAHAAAVAGRDAAEAATRAKSRFMAVVSHEVRTPLNGLLGMLQMLELEDLSEQQRRYLHVAEDSGRTLRSLIDSILDFEHLNAGGDVLALEDADLHRLLTHAIEPLRPQAAAKGVALDLALAPDLPTYVRTDPVRLSRMLLNLVGNAVKFTPSGSVRVEARFAPPCLVVAVADTGIGIAPDMQAAIFDAFVQADDTIARRFGGTGLGLAICRRIAERMGGDLTVESVLGAGSTFRMSVPITVCAAMPAPAAPRDPAAPHGPRLSVLVIDDEAVNREVAAGLLGRLGHRATLADGAEAGLALAAAADFDVVLMDLHMPGLDGIAATRHLRAGADSSRTAVRVLAITADVTGESAARAAAAGMDGMVTKPLALEALREALERPGAVAPAAALQADGLIDLDFLRLGHEALGLDRLVRLAQVFHRASRATLATLDAAITAGDRTAIAADAHRLRSAAGALGLGRLCAAAAAIEEAAATARSADLAQRIAALRPLRRASLSALAAAARQGDAGPAP